MKSERKDRVNSKKLIQKVRRLEPIGLRLVEHELEDIGYDIDTLIERIENYADDIVEHYYGSFVDSRRPTGWGIIYEGIKAWESICKEFNIDWRAPSIQDFVRTVVNILEPITFESKEVPVEDFLDWLEKWIIREGGKYLDKIWKYHTIEYNNEKHPGIVILTGVLKEYNRVKKYSEIRNMGDLARSIASIGKLPVTVIYDPKRFKFGTQTKKGVFISENNFCSSQIDGNTVTAGSSTGHNQQEEIDDSYLVTDDSEVKRKINHGKLHEKLRHLKNKISENREAGYKIDDDFLYNNFEGNIVNQAKESGLLKKRPDGEYDFYGG